MSIFLNYLFIGFILTFLVDYFSFKYKNHKSFKNIPEWTWLARIFFALIWPIGLYYIIRGLFK